MTTAATEHCYTPSWCKCPDEPKCQLCKQGRCPVEPETSAATPKIGDRVTIEGEVISFLSGGKEARVRLDTGLPFQPAVVSVSPDELAFSKPDLCLREVQVTSGTYSTAPADYGVVLCMRPLPCDNPNHKPERTATSG